MGEDVRRFRLEIRASEGSVIRKIYGSKREEDNLYTSQNIFRVVKSVRLRYARHTAHMAEMINAYKILVAKSGRKRPPRRPRHSWRKYWNGPKGSRMRTCRLESYDTG
jgi:hypothetical protein